MPDPNAPPPPPPPPQDPPPPPPPAGLFSQADVDRIVSERLARAKKSSEEAVAQVRAELEQLRVQHEEASGKLSESDKVAKRLAEAEKRAALAEKASAEEKAAHARTRIDTEALRRIGTLDLRDPAGAAVLRRDLAARLRIGESGAIELVGADGAGTVLDDKAWGEFSAKEYGWTVRAAAGSGAPHGRGGLPPAGPAVGAQDPAEVFAEVHRRRG